MNVILAVKFTQLKQLKKANVKTNSGLSGMTTITSFVTSAV